MSHHDSTEGKAAWAAGDQCSGLSLEANPLCHQPSRLQPLLLTDNLELDWTEEDVTMVVGDQEKGRQGAGWNEKSLSLSSIGSDLLSCAYQDHRRRRHPKLAVTYYSFELQVRGVCEKCWRDWRADSRCVES